MNAENLKLVGPVTSVLGSLVALVTALRSGRGRGPAVLSSLLGLAGSLAWLADAYQDHMKRAGEIETA